MKQLSCSSLTDRQIEDIISLERFCDEKDCCKYSVFYESGVHDSNCFFLVYNNNELIAYAGCFSSEKAELSLLFHPDYRTDIFMEEFSDFILDELWEEGHEDCYLSGNKNIEWFTRLLSICNANYSHSEYLMELTELNNFTAIPKVNYRLTENSSGDCTVHTLYINEKTVGHCNVTISGSLINIWDVFVDPCLRNKGLGRLLVSNVASKLTKTCAKDQHIVLQVSSINEYACRLYKACGFTIKESVDYFYMEI